VQVRQTNRHGWRSELPCGSDRTIAAARRAEPSDNTRGAMKGVDSVLAWSLETASAPARGARELPDAVKRSQQLNRVERSPVPHLKPRPAGDRFS